MPAAPRPCPLCSSAAKGAAFPWATHYAGTDYRYFACAACTSRYIDPVPDDAAMAQMYAAGDYHEEFYDGEGHSSYAQTAARIAAHLPPGARVLDYGCGAGHLISALKALGLAAEGAEFSAVTAANAAARSGCMVHDLSADTWQTAGQWDAIHLGDVIEHLADPGDVVSGLIPLIRPGGLLSAEGPLEANRSLVNIAIRLFAQVRRARRPQAISTTPPYHLLFASAAAQRGFFRRLVGLDEVHWEVSDDGWPYRNNGLIRNAIALASIAAAKLPILGLGNRFVVLLRKR